MTAHHVGRHVPCVNSPTERYEIRVAGRLAPRWATFFDGMTLTARPDGTTVIAGPVRDQAALHGLLHTVSDLGLPLVSVTSRTSTTPRRSTT
jgi:hypothetical protein